MAIRKDKAGTLLLRHVPSSRVFVFLSQAKDVRQKSRYDRSAVLSVGTSAARFGFASDVRNGLRYILQTAHELAHRSNLLRKTQPCVSQKEVASVRIE